MHPISKRCSQEQRSDLPLIVYYLQYFHLSIKDGCRKQLSLYSEQRGGPEEWEICTFLRDYIREGMVTPFSLQYPVPFNYSTLYWLKAFGMEIMALRDVDSFIRAWHSWAFYFPLWIQGQFNISILAGKTFNVFSSLRSIVLVGHNPRMSHRSILIGSGGKMLKLNNKRQL